MQTVRYLSQSQADRITLRLKITIVKGNPSYGTYIGGYEVDEPYLIDFKGNMQYMAVENGSCNGAGSAPELCLIADWSIGCPPESAENSAVSRFCMSTPTAADPSTAPTCLVML